MEQHEGTKWMRSSVSYLPSQRRSPTCRSHPPCVPTQRRLSRSELVCQRLSEAGLSEPSPCFAPGAWRSLAACQKKTVPLDHQNHSKKDPIETERPRKKKKTIQLVTKQRLTCFPKRAPYPVSTPFLRQRGLLANTFGSYRRHQPHVCC